MRTEARKPMGLDKLPDFCSLEELSRVLQISRSTAYRMAAQGSIPSLRIGRRVIVPKEHLVRWIDSSVSCEKGGE